MNKKAVSATTSHCRDIGRNELYVVEPSEC